MNTSPPPGGPSAAAEASPGLAAALKRGKPRLLAWVIAISVLMAAGYHLFTGPPEKKTLAAGRSDLDFSETGKSIPGTPPHTPETADPFRNPETPVIRHFTGSPHYAAALSVAGMEENATRTEALEALMETWVADSPELAADWAGSLPAGVFRDDALSALMFHWGRKAPADAALWMTRTGVDDGEAVSVLAGRWSATDPSAAASWAATLGNLESRRDATAAIAGAWAATSPQAAAEWAARRPASERSAAILSVVATWADSSPTAAAGWLGSLTFDSPDEHAAALAVLVTPWTAQSPAAVSRYLNTLPEGPLREAAASQFAVTAAATAPAESLMWAMNLTDPVQRNQVVADACETWYEGSPETFRDGIAEAMGLMEDPAMRKGVYEMLYERDPSFHDNLLQLADPQSVTSAPSPAAAPPASANPVSETVPVPTPSEPLSTTGENPPENLDP